MLLGEHDLPLIGEHLLGTATGRAAEEVSQTLAGCGCGVQGALVVGEAKLEPLGAHDLYVRTSYGEVDPPAPQLTSVYTTIATPKTTQ